MLELLIQTAYILPGNWKPGRIYEVQFSIKRSLRKHQEKMQRMHILDLHNDIHHIPVGVLERDVCVPISFG